MGRGIGGSGRGRGSGRRRISGGDGGRYADIGHYATSSKEKVNSGLSKDLGNSMFTY